MQHAIVQKLRDHLNQGITREADVVYLFIQIGKCLEQEKNPQHPLLRFYRNWIAHAKINDTHLAGEISTALDNALVSSEAGDPNGMTRSVLEVISKERLRDELKKFCESVGLPATLFDSQETWNNFLRLLVRILMDVPLLFTGTNRLRSFRFFEKQFSGELGGGRRIMCEINDNSGGGIAFHWTRLR